MKRYCKKFLSFLFFCLAFFSTQICFGSIKCRGNSSFIKIASGANFVVSQPISNFTGKLIKKSGGTLSGQNITFVDGLLADTFNNIALSTILNPSGFLSMTGSHTLRGIDGTVLQAVQVTGTSNRIEGSPQFSSDITIVNSNANLTMAMQSAMNRNIALNGGTLLLGDDLKFVDSTMITGSGTVSTSGYELEIAGKDIIWTSTLAWSDPSRITLNGNVDFSGTFTFSGISRISGNGNILNLRSGSSLVVNSGSTLFLDDLVLKGLGATGGSLTLLNNSAAVVMSNVDISLAGNITTTIGGITVKGPATWIIKDNTWLFDQVSSLTVDGVTLWKDRAGALSAGTIAFTSPSNLTLVNDGTINTVNVPAFLDSLATSTGYLQSQIDTVRTMDNMIKTSTGLLQSQVDSLGMMSSMLKTSTGYLQSQVDTLGSQSLLRTSTGFLQSQIDVLRSTDNMIKTSTGSLQSQVDSLSVMGSMLKTSTGYLQSQVDVLGSGQSLLKTSTGFLQSQVDSMSSLLRTSTGYLQSQVDSVGLMVTMLKTSTGYLQAQIDAVPGVDAMIKTSTGFLQSQLDSLNLMGSMLKTSTGYLQSQVDVLSSGVQSQVDTIGLMVSMLKTSTGYLQAQIDAVPGVDAMIKTSTGFLQSQLDSLSVMQSMIKTSTGYLQSQVDSMSSLLRTSTGYLQSQIDDLREFVSVDEVISYTQQIELYSGISLLTFSRFEAGIKLLDSNTTVTLDTPFAVNGVVDLNGGTLVLANDLLFNNVSDFIGSGTIIGNNHILDLSPSITGLGQNFVFKDLIINLKADLVLSDTLWFMGMCTINGNGHSINVANGAMIVDGDSMFTIFNTTIVDIAGTNIACNDNAGKIILQDVTWIQVDNAQFATGALQFKNYVVMSGASTFAYQSSQTSTLMHNATLALDALFTFSYDPIMVASKQLFAFEDETSQLLLAGGAFRTTGTGIALTKGTLVVSGNSFMSSENTINDLGITFGDGSSDDDFVVFIQSGIVLNLEQGSINYRNINSSSFVMGNVNSKIIMAPNTTINLYETLNLGSGFLVLGDGVVIGRALGAELIGSIQPLGSYFYAGL